MNKRTRFRAAVLILVIAAAVTWAGGNAGEPVPGQFMADVEQYGRLLAEGKFEEWGMLHAENVVKMPPHAPPVSGRKNVVEGQKALAGAVRVVSMETVPMASEFHGDIHIGWGTYVMEIQPLNGGPAIIDDGKFLTVHRWMNGHWVITYDCFNSNIPLPPPGNVEVAMVCP